MPDLLPLFFGLKLSFPWQALDPLPTSQQSNKWHWMNNWQWWNEQLLPKRDENPLKAHLTWYAG